MGSRLNFATTPVESLIIESYRAKLAIKESHAKFDGKVDATIGKNLKEILTPASEEEQSIFQEAKDFAEMALDESDKDNSTPKSSILDVNLQRKNHPKKQQRHKAKRQKQLKQQKVQPLL